jgi:DNA (cytosine-5)-methyltransferase 1
MTITVSSPLKSFSLAGEMKRKLIGIDLFAGAGGMSLGFQGAGFEVCAAVEYDPIHAATHKFNFPSCATICRSVSDIDGGYIRARSPMLADDMDVDVVFGGAPCQGFSLIGKRSLEDPRNHLVHDFVRLVTDIRPKFFVFENVKGLTVGAQKKFLHELIEEFQRRGYNVREQFKVLNAADYGVPQGRQRLFLLGSRKGLPLPQYPLATHSLDGEKGLLRLLRTPRVWDAIGDLPEADAFPELLERDWTLAKFNPASEYSRPLRQSSDSNGRELLSSSLRTVHTPISIHRFGKTAQGETEPVSRFYKLDPSGICNTIRAGTASDRGAFTSPRPIHPYSARCITVREAARLHSYPDWFRFHVTKWHGFRQVGNSVPPLLARAVALELLKALEVKSDQRLGSHAALENRDGSLLQLDMSDAAELFGVPRNVIPPRRRSPEEAYA